MFYVISMITLFNYCTISGLFSIYSTMLSVAIFFLGVLAFLHSKSTYRLMVRAVCDGEAAGWLLGGGGGISTRTVYSVQRSDQLSIHSTHLI